jgi:hypothetical protein
MSNILPTVGRNVQYINKSGGLQAAIITDVDINGFVTLAVFNSQTGIQFVTDAKEFNAWAFEKQVNVYKLTWQGR